MPLFSTLPDFHLISHHLCPYVQRAVIVLTEKRVEHRRTYIDLANKPDWFNAFSPLGRTPVLEADGAVVFESQVIAEYVDEITPGSLHPNASLDKARCRSWIEFGSETLNAIAGFYNAKSPEAFAEKTAALREKFNRIEREIEGPWFTGEHFSMIDGVWGTIFRYFDVFDRIEDFGVLADLPKAAAWRAEIAERPSVMGAVDDDYPERLLDFLRRRGSHLSSIIAD